MPISEAQKRATYRYRKTEKGQEYLKKYNAKFAKQMRDLYHTDDCYRAKRIVESSQRLYVSNAVCFVKYLYGVPYSNRGRKSKYVC